MRRVFIAFQKRCQHHLIVQSVQGKPQGQVQKLFMLEIPVPLCPASLALGPITELFSM